MADAVLYGVDRYDADTAPLVQATIERFRNYAHMTSMHIYLAQREKSEWLEHLTVLHFEDGGKLTVGCIQRHVGAPFEWHT